MHIQRITVTASTPVSRYTDPKVLVSRTYQVQHIMDQLDANMSLTLSMKCLVSYYMHFYASGNIFCWAFDWGWKSQFLVDGWHWIWPSGTYILLIEGMKTYWVWLPMILCVGSLQTNYDFIKNSSFLFSIFCRAGLFF